jgi:hypothetical protein
MVHWSAVRDILTPGQHHTLSQLYPLSFPSCFISQFRWARITETTYSADFSGEVHFFNLEKQAALILRA